MLDNLRYEFKQTKGMSINEINRDVKSNEFLDCF